MCPHCNFCEIGVPGISYGIAMAAMQSNLLLDVSRQPTGEASLRTVPQVGSWRLQQSGRERSCLSVKALPSCVVRLRSNPHLTFSRSPSSGQTCSSPPHFALYLAQHKQGLGEYDTSRGSCQAWFWKIRLVWGLPLSQHICVQYV